MTSLPANITRAPNMLSRQMLLGNINRSNIGLLQVQSQLSSGLRVQRSSDDPVAASVISALNTRLGRADQLARNYQQAGTVLNQLDQRLGETTDLVNEARSIASGQIGITSSPEERRQQASQIDALLSRLLTNANSNDPGSGLYLFGGSTPGRPPLEQIAQLGGYRYTARGSGLITDLSPGDQIPITLGGGNAIGETSARMRSLTQLSPQVVVGQPLSELRGARGLGVSTGVVSFSFNGGPTATVDLTGAATVTDITTRLQGAIQQYETANSVTVLGPGGVSATASGIGVDVVAGGSLQFSDLNNSAVGLDLGITQAAYTPTNANGAALSPRLTWQTSLNSLLPVTLPLGTVRFRFTSGAANVVRDIDLSSAQTLDDVRSLIEAASSGVRLEINDTADGLVIRNEIAGPSLSVEDLPGSTTASELGLLTLSSQTPLSDFNHGRGVRIVDGQVDPVSGAISPTLNRDFRVTLANGQAFDVDLRPQDLVSAQTLLNRINAEFTTAVGQAPINTSAPALTAGQFTASLNGSPPGIAFTSTVIGGVTVAKLNNSAAADDLGLLNTTFLSATNTTLAQDRAGIRVDNLFTDLVDLRNALLANDSSGITVAGERLGVSGDRVITAEALVGGYSRRVTDGQDRLESQTVLDTQTKSSLEDLDFSEAAVRLSLLQTQLQASLQTAGRLSSISLFDFLS
ncbi:MAG: flagellin [Phycisphaerales bacterium]